MDPIQALIDLMDALTAEEPDGAAEAADALAGWIAKGGFLPKVEHLGGVTYRIVRP